MPVMPWEKTITCPYNISHQITEGRLQRHLVKCRRNHPNSDVVICPFNSCHHIPLPEEQYHRANCQDRKLVEMTKYQLGLGNKKVVPFIPARRVGKDEEDWEAEATIKTSYDPRKKASQLPVLMKLEGATPSQRKEFRAKEKVRLEDLGSGGVETGLRRPQLGGGVLSPTHGIGGRMRGVNSGGLGIGGRGRLITVGRGVGLQKSITGGSNGEATVGFGGRRSATDTVEGILEKSATDTSGFVGMESVSATLSVERKGAAGTVNGRSGALGVVGGRNSAASSGEVSTYSSRVGGMKSDTATVKVAGGRSGAGTQGGVCGRLGECVPKLGKGRGRVVWGR